MNSEGFKGSGNWYKGNLHSHTTNSDGRLRPEEAVELYKNHGYHFLCLSEHDTYTDYRERFNTEEFIVLPGLEASAVLYKNGGGGRPEKVHHIHGILGTEAMQKAAVKPLFRHMERLEPAVYYGKWDGAAAAQQLADELVARGCATVYNHPIWSRTEQEEFIHTKGIFGLEIFNYNTVNESGTGYDVTYWDVMLRRGIKIHGLASDDNHNEGVFADSFGGFVWVKAEELSHDRIIEALLTGNYYSSSGPEIYDWGVRDGVVWVECSPVVRVNVIAGNEVGAGGTVFGGIFAGDAGSSTMTGAEFPLEGDESYVRVECVDDKGRTAWTNALYKD